MVKGKKVSPFGGLGGERPSPALTRLCADSLFRGILQGIRTFLGPPATFTYQRKPQKSGTFAASFPIHETGNSPWNNREYRVAFQGAASKNWRIYVRLQRDIGQLWRDWPAVLRGKTDELREIGSDLRFIRRVFWGAMTYFRDAALCLRPGRMRKRDAAYHFRSMFVQWRIKDPARA